MRLKYVVLISTLLCSLTLHAVEPQIFTSGSTVIVLQEDGSLIGWGSNGNGRLLHDPNQQSYFSKPISLDIDDVETVFPTSYEYGYTIFARKKDKTFWYWGDPSSVPLPSLFQTDNTKPYIPKLMNPLPQGSIKKILTSSPSDGIYILTDDNTLWRSELLGLAVASTQVEDFSILSPEYFSSASYLAIFKTDGSISINNINGSNTECLKDDLSDVKQVFTRAGVWSQERSSPATYFSYSLILKNDGTVWGCGNDYIGIGGTSYDNEWAQVDIEDVVSLSNSITHHTLALKSDGTVWGWGANDYGQLGIGSVRPHRSSGFSGRPYTLGSPSISIEPLPQQAQIDDVVAIAAGGNFSVAIKKDNTIWTWGGYSSEVNRDIPQPIADYKIYMPEGFVGDGIEEFVSLLNIHDEIVDATCFIYYEDGTQFNFPLILPPKQRSTFSVKDKGIDFYRPFAMAIKSKKRITATLAHYAEGNIAMGANFTPTTSDEWATSQGFFSHNNKTRDYLVGLNPNHNSVDVSISLIGKSELLSDSINFTVQAESRFSIKLQDYIDENTQDQSIGALVSADKSIIVGHSHYDDNLNEGTLTIAESNGGASKGRIAEGWLSDTGVEIINLLNVNNKRSLSVYLTDEQLTPENIDTFPIIILQPHQQTSLAVSDFFPRNQALQLGFQADPDLNYGGSIVASFNHFDLSGLTGVNFSSNGYKHWEFAEGFKGDNVQEFLSIKKWDADVEVNIKVTLYYHDGKDNTEIDLVIPADEKKVTLFLHADERVRSDPSGVTYGISIDADQLVVPYFAHYDFNFGGAFALSGTGWNP
ncbi:hypothetical protein [Candidatus Albibeggiatoa sp. nov. BB20]|uniref:RCC1 domain-containing protein n=1 Tax=Candidatus Albibeggiatoa sp. nov. BB20 TaxID=3162723 RepID=UPI00336595B6